MPPLLQVLLPYLDGTHGHAALRMRLATALQGGAAQVPELPANKPTPSHKRIAPVAK
jgi:hypothetical protein